MTQENKKSQLDKEIQDALDRLDPASPKQAKPDAAIQSVLDEMGKHSKVAKGFGFVGNLGGLVTTGDQIREQGYADGEATLAAWDAQDVTGRTETELAVEAYKNAFKDAGLKKNEDGVFDPFDKQMVKKEAESAAIAALELKNKVEGLDKSGWGPRGNLDGFTNKQYDEAAAQSDADAEMHDQEVAGVDDGVTAYERDYGTQKKPGEDDDQAGKPVVLDLNGDGKVSLLDKSESGVFFDVDSDGFKENIGWVSPEDGFLVIDKDNDGNILGEELILSEETPEDDTDLEALATLYDKNNDGVLDHNDVDFSRFKIWRDLDTDGEVDSGELQTLAEHGITSINLQSDNNVQDVDDNIIAGQTTYTKVDGSEGVVADVILKASSTGFQRTEEDNFVRIKAKDDRSGYYAKDDVIFSGVASDLSVNVLTGNNLDNKLEAGLSTDVTLIGGEGNDELIGSSGDDWLSGGIGSDIIQGGSGNDLITFDSDDSVVDGGEGNDVAFVENGNSTTLNLNQANIEAVHGNVGNDYFSYSGSKDVYLYGNDGNDTLLSGAGSDTLVGGAGRDKFDAGDGDDSLFIDAEDLASEIDAGAGNDWVYLQGTGAANIDINAINAENFIGGYQNDVINNSGSSRTYVYGATGDDIINGGSGQDILEGGQGADSLDGRAGFDYLSYERSFAEVQVNLATKAVSGGDAEGDTIVGFEGVIGSSYSDVIVGDSQFNALFGLGGNDILSGGIGGDYLNGGLGSDTASYNSSNAAVQIDLKERIFNGGHATGDRLYSIENIIGSAFNDTLAGDEENNKIEGGAGSDTLSGGEGTDTLSYASSSTGVNVNLETQVVSEGDATGDVVDSFENAEGSMHSDTLEAQSSGSVLNGLNGDDTLTGHDGNDRLEGGAGADILDGGAGLDTLSYEGSDTGVNVNLQTGITSGGHADGDTISNFENIQGSYGDDTLTGDANDNIIEGDLGADTIDGGAGIDTASYEDAVYGVDVDLKRGGGIQHDQLSIELDSNRLSGSAVIDTQDNKRAQHQGTEFSAAYTLATIAAASGWATTSLALDRGDDVNASIGAILSAQHSLTAEEVRPIDQAYLEVSFDAEVATIRYHRADGSLEGQFTVAVEDSTTHKVSFGYDKETGVTSIAIDGVMVNTFAWQSGLDVMAGSYGSNGATATHEEADGGFLYSLGLLTDEAVNDTLTNIENLRGSDNGDRLAGDDGDNVIEGNGGNDIINGGLGADTLSGGKGNDLLIGGESNGDVYRLNRGDGSDTIINSGVNGKVIFGEGISDRHITFEKVNNDLKINYVGIENDVLVTEITDGTAYSSSVTSLPNGDYIILWNSSSGMFIQKYNSSGVTIGDAKKINNLGKDPSLVVLEDGSYVLTWNTGKSLSFHGDGKFQRYDADFNPIGTEINISTDSIDHVITSTSDGGFVISWASLSIDGDSYGISLQRFNAEGVKVGLETRVNTYTQDFQVYPEISSLADGGYVVVWESFQGQDGSLSGIFMQRFSANGDLVGSETQVNTSTTGQQENPDVSVLSDGSYVVVWNERNAVLMQRYDVNGDLIGTETTINTSPAHSYNQPSISSLSDGGFVVVWKKGSSSEEKFASQRFNDQGEQVGPELIINTNKATGHTNVVGLADGSYTISWISTEDGTNKIYTKNIPSSALSDVTIKDWYLDDKNKVSLELNDGTSVSVEGLIIKGNSEDNEITGTSHGDTLVGLEGNDVLKGGNGDDILRGGAGADEFIGGRGVDYLYGGDSDGDIYRSNYGDGTDYIFNNGLNGKVIFGPYIELKDLDFSSGYDDLQISNKSGNGNAVIIKNWFHAIKHQVGLELADGTNINLNISDDDNNSLTGTNLNEVFLGRKGDDVINGGEGNDLLYGEDGNDTLNGDAGDDIIKGGLGDDILDGGGGDDILYSGWHGVKHLSGGQGSDTLYGEGVETIYHYNLGDGKDIIRNISGTGKLIFGEGISAEDLVFSKKEYSLVIILSPEDQIEIKEWFFRDDRQISLALSDGTLLPEIKGVVINDNGFHGDIDGTEYDDEIYGNGGYDHINGGAGNDFIDGGTESDTLTGGKGNDILVGGNSDGDKYHYTIGDGQDIIRNTGKDAKLKLGQGIELNDITFIKSGDNLDLVFTNNIIAPIHDAEAKVSTTSEKEQKKPSIATFDDGSYVVAWESEQDGSNQGIYLQRFDADGSPVGVETQVNSTTADSQIWSSITTLADNGYVVSWSSNKQDGSGYGVFLQRYGADGKLVGGELQVNTYNSGHQFSSAIEALSDGGFVVAWQSQGQDGSDYGIYLQRYAADGTIVGNETLVNTTTTNWQNSVSLTSLADGGYVVTWESYEQDGNQYGIYLQRYAADGSPVGVETQVNTYTTQSQNKADITGLVGGGYVVTWESYRQDGSSDGIYLQQYAVDGSLVGTETLVNTHTSGQQGNPAITSLTNGGYVIVWESSGQEIHLQEFAADGTKVGVNTQVNTYTTASQDSPSISALPNGGYVVAWESYGQDGDKNGIYLQHFGTENNDKITVENWYLDNKHQVSVELEDGTIVPIKLLGTNSDNILVGSSVTDHILGEAGNDSLDGGLANDLLTGGSGNDSFIFKENLGHDTITDFDAGVGSEDSIRIEGLNISTFDAVLQLAEQVGDDTVINIDDDNSITLKDVQKTALHADDFQFV
ncbi:hypothetical protein [Kiloniella litopenaei]|uniref:hypothetical protein n=1 Tax=Kiloniella litopenaei TaxID=1549748 RepID=UPI003BAC97A9